MSKYLALLTTNKEDQEKWMKRIPDSTKLHNHVFYNFTTVLIKQKEYVIYADGEFYNTEDIKHSLSIKGIDKNITSKEELVAYAYHTWGQAMMNHFIGAFSIVIDDGDKVFVAKDQMGLKPIFYGRKKGKGIVISNSLQTILESKAIPAVVDTIGIRELFALGPSIHEAHTLYKDIHALPMGYYMVIHNNNVRLQQYYKPIAKPHFDSYEETIAKVKYLVEQAIISQSKDCNAAFLSGGLDSSIIASVIAKHKDQVDTYSLDYEGNKESFKGNMYQVSLDDEFIKQMIDYTNCANTKYTITQQELADHLKEAMSVRGVAGMGDVDASLLWLCRKVSDDHSTILSGECSDEVFGGYPWFYRDELKDLDTFPWLRSTKERRSLLHENIQSLDYEDYIQRCYKETLKEVTYLDGDSEEDQRARKHTMLCLHWFMQTLVTRQVCMGDGANINIRAPFADIRILDYVYNIPWDMKFADGNEKGILRKAFENELPNDVCYRKKNPFPKTHNPLYTQLMQKKMQEVYDDKDSILHVLLEDSSWKELIDSGGAAFELPWYGQLMSGPQLLAYLYQIDAWVKEFHVEVRI